MILVEKAFDVGGREAELITMRNGNRMEVKLLSYGAAIVDLLVPDRDGNIESVVLSYADVKDYITNSPYFGAAVGRVSGRIAEGSFTLDSKTYRLYKNYGRNHGHGGPEGFSFKLWGWEAVENEAAARVEFSYSSRDMEAGFPGKLDVKITYSLTGDNILTIEYEAYSDRRTLCNLTNHSYFNLSGDYKEKVTEQRLLIKAGSFLELNENQIPTGRLIPVEGTPMDFNKPKEIGRDIEADYWQLRLTNGYDHAWLLDSDKDQVELYDEKSGRKMTVSTTYPSVVVYSYNFPNDEKLRNGKCGSKYDGICFETQYEPDGINHEKLNHAILEAGQKYYEKTEYRFTIDY